MKHLQSDKTRPLTLRDSLMEFYEKHNPDKIKSIDILLNQNFFAENFEKMTVTEFLKSYEQIYKEAPRYPIHFPRYSTPDATPEAEILQSVLQDALTAAAKVHLIETTRNNPGYVRMNQTEILKKRNKKKFTPTFV